MADRLIHTGSSLIQHGKYNDRIYVIKLEPADINRIKKNLSGLIKNNYSKIFIKTGKRSAQTFLDDGFIIEASIPDYYRDDDCVFISKFLSKERALLLDQTREMIDSVRETALKKLSGNFKGALPPSHTMRILKPRDCRNLASLYSRVFASYPFPIFRPSYLKKTMKSHIIYWGIFLDGKLIAASSAETDKSVLSAEMTDFAVLPAQRGKHLGSFLLKKMEQEMTENNYRTLYTIARAESYGINITFSKAGYRFGGTLINNTNISGKIESMNVWYKPVKS